MSKNSAYWMAERRRAWLWPAALALAVAASGCGATRDLLDGGDEAAAQESSGEFPNLADSPGQAPTVTPTAERQRIAEGLLADHANATHTSESFGNLASTVPAAEPPPPPPPPAPEGTTAEAPSDSAATSEEAAAVPETEPVPEAAPTTPVETAAVEAMAAPAESDSAAPAANADTRMVQPVGIIYFDQSSNTIGDEARAVLAEVARLQADTGGILRVLGHASRGSATAEAADDAANQRVSEARAMAVAEVLVGLGVAPKQIEVAGAGSAMPLYDESAPTGEAGNRRAEVYLVY
jgi:outer membrane protein OmpA-like peptidoglycan-associated protein